MAAPPEPVRLLSDWLRANHPSDVLIPCGAGDKRPYYPYRDGWTWSNFDEFIASEAFTSRAHKFDWAIILRSLAVIDCDSKEAATSLQRLFPVLLEVPCARTKKGARAQGTWHTSRRPLFPQPPAGGVRGPP